jgi:serine/threonine-protein kinase
MGQPIQTLVEEFVERLQAGEELDLYEFLLAHPHLAPELEQRLAAAEWLHRQAHRSDAKPNPAVPLLSMVGRYQVRGVLGMGATSVVYRAYDPKFDREVALKVLARDSVARDDALERCRRDARIVAQLRHPNIVPLHETGEEAQHLFLDMELIEGPTLEAFLQGRSLDFHAAAELVRQIATAIDYGAAKK